MFSKFYVYDSPNMSSSEGYEFDTKQDAINYAIANNCFEVEQALWNSHKDYNNYEPADDFKLLWRNSSISESFNKRVKLSESTTKNVMIRPSDYTIKFRDLDGIMGESGLIWTVAELKQFWNSENEYDYTLSEYDNFKSWFSDTIAYMEELDESVRKYNHRKLIRESANKISKEAIDAYISAYGGNKSNAIKQLKNFDEKSVKELIRGFKQNAKSNFYESKSLKEAASNDKLIWSSSSTRDWIYNEPVEIFRQEIIDEGNLDEEEIAEMDEDDIRNYFLDDDWYYWEQDKEDLKNNIIPDIESMCTDGRLWVVGDYQRWDGSRFAFDYNSDVEKLLMNICYPDYDANTYLYQDDKGIYWTETSHDTPMGGSAMYLYTIKDIDKALELADEIYPEDDWEHELYEVEEDPKWIKACIEKGIMTNIKW